MGGGIGWSQTVTSLDEGQAKEFGLHPIDSNEPSEGFVSRGVT